MLQEELLSGQKLQGVLTSNEVQSILSARGWEKDYPLFTTINGGRLLCLQCSSVECPVARMVTL
jgi:hypothetical protein